MIRIDLNKRIKVTPTEKGDFALAVIDKSIKKIIHVEEEFNKPVELKISHYIDLSFVIADKKNKKQLPFYVSPYKTVVIQIQTKALGDQIAWLPIVDLFQKKHNCKIILRCYFDELFKPFYPNLDIRHQYFKGDKDIKTEYIHADAVFVLGYAVSGFNDNEGNRISPVDCRTVPLQALACYQLGIEPQEVIPKFKSNIKQPLVKGKYVVISTCATSKFKLWNNPDGFPKLVKHFKSKGYKVIDVGNATDELKGTISMNGVLEWNKLMNILQHAQLFVSGSNGLQWLAWAVGQKVVTINNITESWTEFKHTKISNKSVCNSCWNDTDFVFDNEDVNYCPRNKDFECSKSITPKMVIKQIDPLLK